jgi:selenocysteine lyase/cysteine desulfurase
MAFFTRRSFLYKTAAASAALFTSATEPSWSSNLTPTLEQSLAPGASVTKDEHFWRKVQQAYTVNPDFINLNNGGVAPCPKAVQEAMKKYFDFSNQGPSYFMWRQLDKGREPLRKNLASLAGCSEEEIAIQRNASEALETVIFGLELKAGDEVVLSRQDYPNMINAWKQRASRDRLKLVWVDLQLPSEDTDYLLNAFTSVFTHSTKVVHITHVINWNGQILPVKRIAGVAREKGIEVLVDGAHSFAQLEFKIPELGADYFGSSLHKWLGAPIGSGMLYVKKEKIKALYPLFAGEDAQKADIRKFENLGTRPFFIEQAIDKAISFHEMIGASRKQERLLYLRNYWIDKIRQLPGLQLSSPVKEGFGSALALISFEGRKPAELESFLFNDYKVHVVTIDRANLKGIRITPNIYTSTKNLDVLVNAIHKYLKT